MRDIYKDQLSPLALNSSPIAEPKQQAQHQDTSLHLQQVRNKILSNRMYPVRLTRQRENKNDSKDMQVLYSRVS